MTRVGVTPGCPAGIGPEVAARALAETRAPGVRFVWMASRAQLLEGARRARVRPARLARIECAVADVDDPGARVRPGAVDDAALESQRAALLLACAWARRGALDGIVTAPVRKRALVVDGVAYPGQTEIVERFLGGARQATAPAGEPGRRRPAPPPGVLMVFAGAPFVLGLSTVHVALKDVAGAVTPALLDGALLRLDAAARAILRLRRAPRIAVLGVNPHAGEGGMFGREEIDVVAPAVARAVAAGLDARGPLPADGFFADVARAQGTRAPADAVLAMHHDQGLGPYKLLVGGTGINVTWGARVPRTSPDHGTADALAGRGTASASSMSAALDLCARLARRPR